MQLRIEFKAKNKEVCCWKKQQVVETMVISDCSLRNSGDQWLLIAIVIQGWSVIGHCKTGDQGFVIAKQWWSVIVHCHCDTGVISDWSLQNSGDQWLVIWETNIMSDWSLQTDDQWLVIGEGWWSVIGHCEKSDDNWLVIGEQQWSGIRYHEIMVISD